MGEVKHTPGPWEARIDMMHKPMVIRGREGGFVIRGMGREREIADARLIAAAPDMLEALKAIAKHRPDYAGNDWDVVDEAIAKAESSHGA